MVCLSSVLNCPWINAIFDKYFQFPTGHPEIIRDNFDLQLDAYFGVANCIMLPPQDLLFPVLPARIHNKLMFVLCRTCCELGQQTACKHTSEQRQLTGSWVTLEIYEAMRQGYTLVKMHEVWHYPESTQFDPLSPDTPSFFAGYINTMLKYKMEASDYPAGCTSPQQQAEYVADIKQKERIDLDPGKIRENKGLRSLIKVWYCFA